MIQRDPSSIWTPGISREIPWISDIGPCWRRDHDHWTLREARPSDRLHPKYPRQVNIGESVSEDFCTRVAQWRLIERYRTSISPGTIYSSHMRLSTGPDDIYTIWGSDYIEKPDTREHQENQR
jgi:hypothetical protein